MGRCLVTGATGFLGEHLVEGLLDAGHNLTLLVRNPKSGKIQEWMRKWNEQQHAPRVSAVRFDLGEANLGLDADFSCHDFEHVYHLAAIYDLSANPVKVFDTNVQGTGRFLEKLQNSGFQGTFHFVSSIAVAGDYKGVFDESMFDEGQQHPHVYHQSKFQSEALVRDFRDNALFRIMIYRPAAIIGHSKTGYIDKIDGPYYLFTLISQIKRWVPGVVSLPVIQTAITLDMVPVDYVVQSLIYLSQKSLNHGDNDTFCFHLTDPDSPSLSDLFLLLLNCADGPGAGVRIPIDGLSNYLGFKQLKLALQLKAVRMLKKELFELLRLPEGVFDALMPGVVFQADKTRSILRQAGIEVPPVDAYIEILWQYYSKHLDPYKHRSVYAKKALKGKRVLITGASSGIGLESAKVAYEYGADLILVARHADKLESAKHMIKAEFNAPGQIITYPCDLSDLDECDKLVEYMKQNFGTIDILFSNAGRSIRRSVAKSEGRFHDLQRTMQLNYFGAARLILGLLPLMQAQGGGHVIHSSSMGTLSATPRFGPYMASKIALDTLMDSMAAELANHNIQFSSIKFPLVKTPMVAPTAAFKKARLTSPQEAAMMFLDTVIEKTRHKMTISGSLLGFIAWISPNFMTQLYNYGFQIWPDEPSDFPELELDRVLMKYFIPNSPL